MDETESFTSDQIPAPSVKMRHYSLWDRNPQDEDDDEPDDDTLNEDVLYDETLDLKDMSLMMN